jgi:hypothetical protein
MLFGEQCKDSASAGSLGDRTGLLGEAPGHGPCGPAVLTEERASAESLQPFLIRASVF